MTPLWLKSSPALLSSIYSFIPAISICTNRDRFQVFVSIWPAFQAIADRTAAPFWWTDARQLVVLAATWTCSYYQFLCQCSDMVLFILYLVLEATESLSRQIWITDVERKRWKFKADKSKSCRWLRFLQSPFCLHLLYFIASKIPFTWMEQRFVGFPFWAVGFGRNGCVPGWLQRGYNLQVVA